MTNPEARSQSTEQYASSPQQASTDNEEALIYTNTTTGKQKKRARTNKYIMNNRTTSTKGRNRKKSAIYEMTSEMLTSKDQKTYELLFSKGSRSNKEKAIFKKLNRQLDILDILATVDTDVKIEPGETRQEKNKAHAKKSRARRKAIYDKLKALKIERDKESINQPDLDPEPTQEDCDQYLSQQSANISQQEIMSPTSTTYKLDSTPAPLDNGYDFTGYTTPPEQDRLDEEQISYSTLQYSSPIYFCPEPTQEDYDPYLSQQEIMSPTSTTYKLDSTPAPLDNGYDFTDYTTQPEQHPLDKEFLDTIMEDYQS